MLQYNRQYNANAIAIMQQNADSMEFLEVHKQTIEISLYIFGPLVDILTITQQLLPASPVTLTFNEKIYNTAKDGLS